MSDAAKQGILDWLLAHHAEQLRKPVIEAWNVTFDTVGAIDDTNLSANPDVIYALQNNPELKEQVETTLAQLGICAEMLEYEDSGQEAVVFRIKGVQNVVLKLSLFSEPGSGCPYVMQPHDRILVKSPNQAPRNHNPYPAVSIAFSPRLDGTYSIHDDVGKPRERVQAEKQWEKENPNATFMERLKKFPEPRVSHYALCDLVRMETFNGRQLKYEDAKPANTRYHTDFPELPFIIDMRAVRVGNIARPLNPTDLAKQQQMRAEYKAANEKILSSWGTGHQAAGNIINTARAAVNLPAIDPSWISKTFAQSSSRNIE